MKDPIAAYYKELRNTPLAIPVEELMELVHAIEKGEAILRPAAEPQKIYAGNVPYTVVTTTGAAEKFLNWEVWVFNDCNEWDYFDSFTSPDGRTAHYDQFCDIPSVGEYRPTDQVAWERYQIPGYLKFRCRVCKEVLKEECPHDRGLTCASCAEMKVL